MPPPHPQQPDLPPAARRVRYLMIGGFLGAGKTTAVSRLAQWLTDQGFRVGLITNDQGRDLVDTALLRARGFATEEIPGGCFCCRFDSLLEAAKRLTAQQRPDVFIAEPVGSCTDLAATVSYPLRRLYGGAFAVAPISVLVDPIRGLRAFGLAGGGVFSAKVLYIYFKQIEEADVVVISKCDLVGAAQLGALRQAIGAKFPGKEVHVVSARTGENLELWFNRITRAEQASQSAMPVDYPLYAEGEALLGWLNSTVRLQAPEPFDANEVLPALARAIQKRLSANRAEIAHLKMTLSPDGALGGEIAAVSLVRNDFVPELAFELPEPVTGGRLIINLRAEAAPEVLGSAVREGLSAVAADFAGLSATIEHLEQFRPGKPTPTHRLDLTTD